MAVTLACTSWCKIIAASLHLQGCICHYSLAMLQAKVTAKIVPTQAICIEFPNCDMPKSILQGGIPVAGTWLSRTGHPIALAHSRVNNHLLNFGDHNTLPACRKVGKA